MANESDIGKGDGGHLRPLRLADLAALDPASHELAEQLRALDRAARLVIGDNLARGSLGLAILHRLGACVDRQIQDAEALLAQFDGSGVSADDAARLAGLRDFLEASRREIDRQSGASTRSQ